MSRIFISQEVDPYFNIAAEYQLFKQADEEPCLFLWQNQPCVVIGRNQNLYAECDMKYLGEKNIKPARRFSGGGAVFQDMGNLNFTFIIKEDNATPEAFIKLAQRAVESLGVECTFSGRNDLLYQGKKISGHANYREDGNYMYHGTMMVNVDLVMLSSVLKPSFLKLDSKGIDSVLSRVVNVSEINPDISDHKMKEAFIQAFSDTYGETHPIQYVNKDNMKPEFGHKIQQPEWIYGEAPQFEIQVERRLSTGNATVSVQVRDGCVVEIEIYTDSLLLVDFSSLKNKLVGMVYDENKFFEMIDEFICNYQ